MLIDPCKSTKCLKYPICIQKEHIYEEFICISLHGFILDYIQNIRETDILFPKTKATISLLPQEARKLYRVLHHIFPKLKTISFIFETYTQISFDSLTVKTMDPGDHSTMKYYSLADTCKHVYMGKSKVHHPFEV